MTIQAIIQEAEAEGAKVRLSATGSVVLSGHPAAIERWLPVLRERKPEIQTALASATTAGRAALDLLNRSGARLLPHKHRTVAVPRRHDTPALRQALAVFGYGSYAVRHLDTAAFRGQGIDLVEAALRRAGGGSA